MSMRLSTPGGKRRVKGVARLRRRATRRTRGSTRRTAGILAEERALGPMHDGARPLVRELFHNPPSSMGVRPVRILVPLVLAVVALAGCEPYMSMTDQIPEQTRAATALLPESPRYVGMVDLETVMTQIDEVSGVHFADSLRQTDNPHLRAFLDATGMDPETDLKAIYGAMGSDKSFSAVLFADLTPTQFDRYLNQAPEAGGESTTYRDVSVYHLTADTDDSDDSPSDTLSLAFVRSGVIAITQDAEQLRAMIDRHRESARGFREDGPYMTLVKRVGHGSTAWFVGRDVLETALQDSTRDEALVASSRAAGIKGTGIHQVLSTWSDRVLGLSEAPSSFEGEADGKVGRLRSEIREQAVSITLTDESVDGEVYLTMRDESSASDVVSIAKGAVAAMRLSDEDQREGLRELMDGIDIERNGSIVHVQFTVSRGQVEQSLKSAALRKPARPSDASIRPANGAVRRMGSIFRGSPALGKLRI